MHRRHWLKLGVGTGAVIALAGAGAAWWVPGWRGGRLSMSARTVFLAVAGAVLEGGLPVAPAAREAALQAHLGRVESSLAGLAPATRAELSDLLALLCTAPGRLALTGLSTDWARGTPAEVGEVLRAMRVSGSSTRQQVYHALRDLTNAAYFADASTWPALGYPGPMAV